MLLRPVPMRTPIFGKERCAVTKPKNRTLRAGIVILLVVFAAALRFIGNYGVHSPLPGLLRSVIYISLMGTWWFSVQSRVIQTKGVGI